MKNFIFLLFTIFIANVGFSQSTNPTDFLPKEFHQQRREILRSKMPNNSVAVVFSNTIRNRANDVDFIFHQDPNFYYLTGYREPSAVLLIFSDEQTNDNGETFNEIIYVQEKNVRSEMWNGVRLGKEGTKSKLGFSKVENGIDFIQSNINFKQFDQVFIDGKFKDDYRDISDKASIYELVKSFKEKSEYNPNIKNTIESLAYRLISKSTVENKDETKKAIVELTTKYRGLKNDPFISDFIDSNDFSLLKDIQRKTSLALQIETNINLDFFPNQMATLREVKTDEEIVLLTKAIRISAMGQIEVMKAMKPHMSETELQGIHEFVYKKYGAEYEGYPSIVGAGNNGCVLHYIENSKTKVGNDLVLMDLGAEYRGYTADVTRTIPANGKFTPEQKAIYDIVFKAQDAGIAAYTIGTKISEPKKIARQIINEGLLKLGIIKSLDEKHSYLPHGTTHHIGLDVHDPGNYKTFEKNMVLTMEPGIYIPYGSPCDKKWWGIAVRIEDDILITENGPINLSYEAPRTTKAIEKMMAKSSVLNAFILPNLDNK